MKMSLGIFLVVFRILIGALFILSGILTLTRDYENFILVVKSYKVLNEYGAIYVARLLPWAELLLGFFLVVGFKLKPTLIALWVLISAFIGVVGSALFRKLPIEDCGCFGEKISFPLKNILIFDITLWIILLLLVVFYKHLLGFSLDGYFQKKAGIMEFYKQYYLYWPDVKKKPTPMYDFFLKASKEKSTFYLRSIVEKIIHLAEILLLPEVQIEQ